MAETKKLYSKRPSSKYTRLTGLLISLATIKLSLSMKAAADSIDGLCANKTLFMGPWI